MFLRSALLATVLFAYGSLAAPQDVAAAVVPVEAAATEAAQAEAVATEAAPVDATKEVAAAVETTQQPASETAGPKGLFVGNLTRPLKQIKPATFVGLAKPVAFAGLAKPALVKPVPFAGFVKPLVAPIAHSDDFHNYLSKDEKEELSTIFKNRELSPEDRKKALDAFEESLGEDAKAQFHSARERFAKKIVERKEQESKLSDDAKAALKQLRENQKTFRAALAKVSEDEKRTILHLTAPLVKKNSVEKKEDELSVEAAHALKQILGALRGLTPEDRKEVVFQILHKKPCTKKAHGEHKDHKVADKKVVVADATTALPVAESTTVA